MIRKALVIGAGLLAGAAAHAQHAQTYSGSSGSRVGEFRE